MNKELKSENISVKVEKESGCKVKFDISVTPSAAKTSYNKAIKAVNKEVSLPGFRKGKAPTAVILKHYKSHVDNEWKDLLVQTAFQEAVNLTKLFPMNQNTISKPKLENADLEKGAEIKIEFESAPEVPEVDPKSVEIKKVEPKEITESDVQESLDQVRWHHAAWENITDREVQEEDCIKVDIENLDEPGKFICQDTVFEVANGKMGEWMHKLVLGMKIGDEKEGKTERSEQMPKDAEFKSVKCKITLKEIQKPTLPELDDELAKKVGAESVKDLTEKAEARLKTQAEMEAKGKMRNDFEDKLLEKYPFELPSSLVQAEMKSHLEQARKQLSASTSSTEELTEKLREASENIEKGVVRSLRMFFLSRKVASEENLDVSQEELMQEMVQQMYSQGSQIDPSANIEQLRTKIYYQVLGDKVSDHLLEQAKLV